MFGVWETGPWLGYKTMGDSVFEWLALGENFLHDLQIWRHSCFSIDFETGDIKLVENGETRFRINSEDLHQLTTINHVSVGCLYNGAGSAMETYMSMYGRVTDMQIFGRILSEEDLKKFTNCEERKEGDVLSWDKTNWILNGGDDNIDEEMLDLQNDICKSSKTSFHLIPLTRNFQHESEKSCQKLSGAVAEYTTKGQLDEIIKFLSQRNIMNSTRCKDEKGFSTWVGNDDEDTEGRWRTRTTNEEVSFLPWAVGRPYSGGDKYNCMRLKIDVGDTSGEKAGAVITDEECQHRFYCPLCIIQQPTLKIFVRGLCRRSMLDNVYMYNIDNGGNIVYVGERTSVIFYNETMNLWVWYDMHNNKSVATSSAPQGSLLIGVQTVDFKDMTHDKCQNNGRFRKLKLTTCEAGQFTCRKGLCVPIEARCDQTAHCPDGSDEENCRLVTMKESYNGNIPPFSYDAVNKMYFWDFIVLR